VRRPRAIALLAAVALAALLAVTSTASARDPGKWVLTGASSVPNDYWQGLTSDPSRSNLFLVGPFQGLWQTTPQLEQTAGVSEAIPTGVRESEGYNHIGDPTWLPGEGGRVLLPMECFNPGADPSNTCGRGAFGVADPETLGWRYYVQLDPAFIPKAMWAETSPNGKLIWTSSGDDLIAYDASQISRQNAAPSGPQLDPVRRLAGAVPPTGITGAVFRKHKLLLAGEANHTYQVWAIDTRTGDRTLQLEMHICGESEGLDTFSALGGRLHWLIAPADPGCELTFGPTSALLHFRRPHATQRYEVGVTHVKQQIDSGSSQIQVEVTAKVVLNGRSPVRGAWVRFAGARARTGAGGVATVSTTLETPGRFAVFARKHKRYGISKLVQIGIDETAPSGPRITRGRG
jgi:hypothetical protein